MTGAPIGFGGVPMGLDDPLPKPPERPHHVYCRGTASDPWAYYIGNAAAGAAKSTATALVNNITDCQWGFGPSATEVTPVHPWR